MTAARPTAPAPVTANDDPAGGPELVEHGASAGVDPAAQRCEHLGGYRRVDPDDAGLDDVGVGSERRLSEEVRRDGSAILRGQGGTAVASTTAEVLSQHVLAVGHAPGSALPASAAVSGGEHHVVAGTDSGDRPAHLLGDPGALVTQDGGQGCRGKAVSDDGVGVTDSRRDHPDPDLVVADLVELKLFQAQRGMVLAGDRRGDRRHRWLS